MPSSGVRSLEDAIPARGPDYPYDFKGQSAQVPYDKLFTLNRCLTKSAILLSQYDMQFYPQKAIKGQAIDNFLVKNPGSDRIKMHESLPDKTADALSMHATPQV